MVKLVIGWAVAERASKRSWVAGVVHRGHDLLPAGEHDGKRRKGRDEVAVAFVGHQQDAARFGDERVRADEAGIGIEKSSAEDAPCETDKAGDVVWRGALTDGRLKQRGNLGAVLVNGRDHHVAWQLAGDLHDPLAKVGFDDRDSGSFEVGIEQYLLGRHTFALRKQPSATLPEK
ncbi:MAG: hypothetical protein KatS3mg060_1327 [Dehalococcoidia bacterium]|nr:MAG: hypothetical protein KatS3mg060_1327 [Dehalococcoidia bacterium]